MMLSLSAFAQKVKTVEGEYTYYAPENVTVEQAKITADDRAKIQALADEFGHGMFTYYLLKKLKDTKGDITFGELADYVTNEVMKQSVVTNGKMQTP
jgi:hypothetical protein